MRTECIYAVLSQVSLLSLVPRRPRLAQRRRKLVVCSEVLYSLLGPQSLVDLMVGQVFSFCDFFVRQMNSS